MAGGRRGDGHRFNPGSEKSIRRAVGVGNPITLLQFLELAFVGILEGVKDQALCLSNGRNVAILSHLSTAHQSDSFNHE